MEPIIRKRKVEDSLELANCIAAVWNATYKGIVDDEFLDNLSKNVNLSAERLKKEIQPHYYVMVLDNKIIGWVYFTLDSDAAEIHSLYIMPEYQKKGYGKLLYKYAVNIIKNLGIKRLVIGCLNGNPSNDFYKHLGGTFIGTRLFRDTYIENIYLFEL